MNLEKIIPMAMRNKVVMGFITKKAESFVRGKMGEASHVQIETEGGNTLIKATDGERFWIIPNGQFLNIGAGFDIIKLAGFISIGGKKLDLENVPDMTILLDGSEQFLVISCTMPNGETVISGTMADLLKRVGSSVGDLEIEDGAKDFFENESAEGGEDHDGEGLKELPQNIQYQ